MNKPIRPLAKAQRGLTLVELLVAMTVGLLVTLVAIGLVLLAGQGLRAVDEASDARDKERLAFEQIARIILQAGYEDWGNPAAPWQSLARRQGNATDPEPEPDMFGWDNAIFSAPADDALSTTTAVTNGNRPSRCGKDNSPACENGSDILVVRFQGSGAPDDPDGSMLNCNGWGVPGLSDMKFSKRSLNVFHVGMSSGDTEPSLRCSVLKKDGTWDDARPLLEGVESFQVLYGTDGVQPGLAPNEDDADGVADRWLRADELTVAGNAAATRANWRLVRAVRIGLVVRGPVGSAISRETRVLHPLGAQFASKDDAGSILSAPADGRLRTTRSITLHLRNDLSMP